MEQDTTRNGAKQSVADLGVPVPHGDEDCVARVLLHLVTWTGSVSGVGVTDPLTSDHRRAQDPSRAKPRRFRVERRRAREGTVSVDLGRDLGRDRDAVPARRR